MEAAHCTPTPPLSCLKQAPTQVVSHALTHSLSWSSYGLKLVGCVTGAEASESWPLGRRKPQSHVQGYPLARPPRAWTQVHQNHRARVQCPSSLQAFPTGHHTGDPSRQLSWGWGEWGDMSLSEMVPLRTTGGPTDCFALVSRWHTYLPFIML